MDFNDDALDLIPHGTPAKAQLTIQPGGYNDPDQGWTGGYVAEGSSGTHYLKCKFTIVNGPYAGREIYSLIGLHSPKGPTWGNMGRRLIRGILSSARGVSDRDNDAEAQAARRIESFAELDGLEFVARIDVGTDQNGQPKNEIRVAITPDHEAYAATMSAARSD